MEDLIHYVLDEPNLDHFFLIGAILKERKRTKLIEFLKANIEVFVCIPYKMSGIDQNFIKHKLNVILKIHLVKKRGRRSASEHVDAVIEEVKKQTEASAITKILYPS